MTKLYGTADAALVSAAFRHGQSMVPGDMKGVYEWQVENFERFTTGISKMFDKIYADKKNTMDLLTDTAQKAWDSIEGGDGPVNEHAHNMNNEVVNGFKDRFRAINAEYGIGKGGDLERSKLRAEMNRYLNNLQGNRDMIRGIRENAANSRLLADLGDDRAKLMTMILDDSINGTSNAKSTYDNGEIVYSVPGSDIKLSMREINEGLSAYDPAYLTGIQKKLTSFQARGRAMGGQMTEDDALRFKNDLQSSMVSWDEIRNVSQEKFGKMRFTFEQVLTGQAKDPKTGKIDASAIELIYSELEALGSIDVDNDGDIDETDKSLLAQAKRNGEIYTNPKNGFTLIDALKKDKQKYRDVLANYLTETAVKDFYGQGAAQFKGRKGTGTGKGGPNQFFLGKQYIPAAAVTPDVDILNKDPKDIPARTAWNNTMFRKVGGQYQIYQDEDFVDVTKERLRATLEFTEKVGYDMSGAGTPATVAALEVPTDFDKAFRDDEEKVVQYFANNPNLYPGMIVKRTTKDDPEDGNDTFRITMPDGTSKVFTADPLTGDKRKIKDVWDWINNNYVNNEFAR